MKTILLGMLFGIHVMPSYGQTDPKPPKNPPVPAGAYLPAAAQDARFPLASQETEDGPARINRVESGYLEFAMAGATCTAQKQQFSVQVNDGDQPFFRWSAVWNCEKYEGSILLKMTDPDIAIQKITDGVGTFVYVMIVGVLPTVSPNVNQTFETKEDAFEHAKAFLNAPVINSSISNDHLRGRIGMLIYRWQADTEVGFRFSDWNNDVKVGEASYFNAYGMSYASTVCGGMMNYFNLLPGDISLGRSCAKPSLDVNELGQVALVWEEREGTISRSYQDFPFYEYVNMVRTHVGVYMALGYINGVHSDAKRNMLNEKYPLPIKLSDRMGGRCGRPNMAIAYPICSGVPATCEPTEEVLTTCFGPNNENQFSILIRLDRGLELAELEGAAICTNGCISDRVGSPNSVSFFGDNVAFESGDLPELVQYSNPHVAISNMKTYDGLPASVDHFFADETSPVVSHSPYCKPVSANSPVDVTDSTIVTVIYSRMEAASAREVPYPCDSVQINGTFARQYFWGGFCGRFKNFFLYKSQSGGNSLEPTFEYFEPLSNFTAPVCISKNRIRGAPGRYLNIAARNRAGIHDGQSQTPDNFTVHHYTLVCSGVGGGCNENGYYIDSPISILVRRDYPEERVTHSDWMPVNGAYTLRGSIMYPAGEKFLPYPTRRNTLNSQATLTHLPNPYDEGQVVLAWTEVGETESRIVSKAIGVVFDKTANEFKVLDQAVVPFGIVNSAATRPQFPTLAGRSGDGSVLFTWLHPKEITDAGVLIKPGEFRYKVSRKLPGVESLVHDCNAK